MRRQVSNSTKKPIHLAEQDLASLLISVSDEYFEKFARQGITLELDIPHELPVFLDAVLMRDAFRKLIDNAVEAMPQGGEIVITAIWQNERLSIEFADSGPGISEELQHRLFEPFASTKHDHAGLGLCMVRDIVSAHQGNISASNCPEGGAALTIQLPLVREQRMAA